MIPVRHDLVTQQSMLSGASSIGARAVAGVTTGNYNCGEVAKLEQAGRDFESVFLRQMLSALERTTKVGNQGPNIAGQQAYGSMIVEAVADAVAGAGGLGLGAVLVKALAQKSEAQGSAQQPAASHSAASPQDSAANQANDRAGKPSKALPTAGIAGDPTEFAKKLPQGSCLQAVPRTEIRTSPAQMTGQLVDRRIR